MHKKSKIGVIIVAAGASTRVGGKTPKQYESLAGVAVLRHSAALFAAHPQVSLVRVVIREQDRKLYKDSVAGLSLLEPVLGGKTRQESVRIGLESLKDSGIEKVLIHDAARPFIDSDLITKVIEKLMHEDAVIPGLAVADTIKTVRNGKIRKSIARENIMQVQTPQGFTYSKILALHRQCRGENFSDDANLFEICAMGVAAVAGGKRNFKITSREDLDMARKLMEGAYETRIGKGYDVHAFSSQKGRGLKICGIKIPYARSLAGHSDADVGLHALVDAILGSIGAGDIGEHFPPSNKKWKGADSSIFVELAVKLLKKQGGRISNVDLTIIAEEPKISPHKEKMVDNLSKLLEIEAERINVKATTTERLGFIGRKEGMAAEAVVSVRLLPNRLSGD